MDQYTRISLWVGVFSCIMMGVFFLSVNAPSFALFFGILGLDYLKQIRHDSTEKGLFCDISGKFGGD